MMNGPFIDDLYFVTYDKIPSFNDFFVIEHNAIIKLSALYGGKGIAAADVTQYRPFSGSCGILKSGKVKFEVTKVTKVTEVAFLVNFFSQKEKFPQLSCPDGLIHKNPCRNAT